MTDSELFKIEEEGLNGKNAKERKLQRQQYRMSRAPEDRKVVKGPSAMAPPPPLCNRVAKCEWKSGGSKCSCELWPQWLRDYGVPSGRAHSLTEPGAKFDGDVTKDSKAVGLSAEAGTDVSYLRPSGSKGFFYYSGKISKVWKVLFPSGQSKHVVAVN